MIRVSNFYALNRSFTQAVRLVRTERIKDHSFGCCLDTAEVRPIAQCPFWQHSNSYILARHVPSTWHHKTPPSCLWAANVGVCNSATVVNRVSTTSSLKQRTTLSLFRNYIYNRKLRITLVQILMSHKSGPEHHSQMLPWWLDLASGHSKFMTFAAFPVCPGNGKLLFERKVTTVW